MPFRHIAMFRWADHVDADHVEQVREALDQLAAQVKVRHHAHGNDIGMSADAFDFHVVADFETLADWRTYRDHPLHVLLVAELIDGHVIEQATGQYRTPVASGGDEISAAGSGAFVDGVGGTDGADQGLAGGPDAESDEALLERARRAAMAEMQALLAEPDELM